MYAHTGADGIVHYVGHRDSLAEPSMAIAKPTASRQLQFASRIYRHIDESLSGDPLFFVRNNTFVFKRYKVDGGPTETYKGRIIEYDGSSKCWTAVFDQADVGCGVPDGRRVCFDEGDMRSHVQNLKQAPTAYISRLPLIEINDIENKMYEVSEHVVSTEPQSPSPTSTRSSPSHSSPGTPSDTDTDDSTSFSLSPQSLSFSPQSLSPSPT